MKRTAARPGPAMIVRGVLFLATGRAAGIAHFPADRDGVLASLAPMIALPLVGSGMMLLHGVGLPALEDLAQALVGVLAPAVISHALVGWWKRRDAWARYIIAFDWCQWVLPPLLIALLLVAALAMQAGLPQQEAAFIPVCGVSVYALWLHWFVARHALSLGAWRAVLHVALVALGTGALVLLPTLAGHAGMDAAR